MPAHWKVCPPIPYAADQALAPYPPLVRHLLFHRGVGTSADAAVFLEPNYERDVHDPFCLRGVSEAVARITAAVQAGERIVIFADYDADGVPGAAVFHSFFTAIGHHNFEVYIPHRHEEAYGLTAEAVEAFAAAGTTLLITVDCGIADVEPITRARAAGIDVIVTDHHLPPAVLPPATVIVNPKQPGETYPEPMLCGAAVAWKVVVGLARSGTWELPPDWEKWLLDLVGIATIADMVPLAGENRALALFGLEVLRRTPRLGLRRLARTLRIDLSHASADDVAFMIAPRLNAASRMSHGSEAFRLLVTVDESEAAALADRLETLNRERKHSVAAVLREVEPQAPQLAEQGIIVAGHEGWNLGVLGLAAAKLADTHGVPVFLWSLNGRGEVKGSCRSARGIDIVALMTRAHQSPAGGEALFLGFGGHVAAGGFSIARERIDELSVRLTAASVTLTAVEPELIADTELALGAIGPELARDVARLEPFGVGNPKPIFLFRRLTLQAVRRFGPEGTHLELGFRGGLRVPRAVSFFAIPADPFGLPFDPERGHRFAGVRLVPGAMVDLLATIEISHYRSRPEVRLRIVDLRAAE